MSLSPQPPIIPALLNPSLAHVVFSAGYDKTSTAALTTLSDAFVQYLAHLAQTAVGAASVAGRSRPNGKDVALAVDIIGRGWPGGGMKDLLEWFEEEKRTRTNDEAALFDGLDLPADEWITGFVTGGRARIPNDHQEYSYVQVSTTSDESREDEEWGEVDVDMNIDLDTEMELCDTPSDSYKAKAPQRRRPEHIPDHLPPFPDELSNPESGSGGGESDATVDTPIAKKIPAEPTLVHATETVRDATESQNKSKMEVIPETTPNSSKTHATKKSDQQQEYFFRSNNESAPSNTNGPVSSNKHSFHSAASQSPTKAEKHRSIFEAYTQTIPFTKSRLKEHTMAVNLDSIRAKIHATDQSEARKDDVLVSRRSSATSATSTSSSTMTYSSRRHVKIPHKDRPIRAIQELEKVLASLPAATASNGNHSSGFSIGTGLEAGIRIERGLAEDRSTDTLFDDVNISLLDKVVRNCSPPIVKLVTPTPIPIELATSPMAATSGPLRPVHRSGRSSTSQSKAFQPL